MPRTARRLVLAAALAALAPPALAQEAGLVRIEPRPFYGATVTLEEGVRVYRPLPATRYMVINPGSRTPVNLGITDTRIEERSENHHYHYGNRPVVVGGGSGGLLVPRATREDRGERRAARGAADSGR